MNKRWKPWLALLVLLVLWLAASTAIRTSLPDQLTDSENALLREALKSFCDSDDAFYSDVLYDSQGTPLWMYGESAGGCVIMNRVTGSVSEAGERKCYDAYHDCRKYYAAPLGHIVESKYVPDEEDSADEGYFFMGPNRHLDSFSPGVIGWIWSNLKLPAQVLKSLLSGNAIPIK